MRSPDQLSRFASALMADGGYRGIQPWLAGLLVGLPAALVAGALALAWQWSLVAAGAQDAPSWTLVLALAWLAGAIAAVLCRLLCRRPAPSPYEPDASVDPVPAQAVQTAVLRRFGGDRVWADRSVGPSRVVWTDLGDEVIVHLDSLRFVAEDGLIRASIDLESDQTGRQSMTVEVALGDTRDDGALVATMESVPQGHAGLAARWGQAIQAAVWGGVLDLAQELADAHDGVPGRIWVEQGQVLFEASTPIQPAHGAR